MGKANQLKKQRSEQRKVDLLAQLPEPDLTALATPEEVMELLSISRRTLQRLIASNQIPGLVKVGRQNRFVMSDIKHWILQQRNDHALNVKH